MELPIWYEGIFEEKSWEFLSLEKIVSIAVLLQHLTAVSTNPQL